MGLTSLSRRRWSSTVLIRLRSALQCAPQLGVLAQQALLCAAAGGARVSPCIPAACTAIIVQTQARALCSNVQDTCKACWRPAGSEEQDIVRALRTKRADTGKSAAGHGLRLGRSDGLPAGKARGREGDAPASAGAGAAAEAARRGSAAILVCTQGEGRAAAVSCQRGGGSGSSEGSGCRRLRLWSGALALGGLPLGPLHQRPQILSRPQWRSLRTASSKVALTPNASLNMAPQGYAVLAVSRASVAGSHRKTVPGRACLLGWAPVK